MYTIPSLRGLITHDYLSYEGIKKDDEIYLIMEGENKVPETPKILINYQNDLYVLIQKKLTSFIESTEYNETESLKLSALLQELIKVKQIVNGSKK